MRDTHKLAESLRNMRSVARRHHDGAGGKVRWSVVLDTEWAGDLSDAADLIEQMERSLDFYRRRVEELQRWQGSMRDPERTVVCDILANGKTLPSEFAGDRYTVKEAPAVLLTDEQIVLPVIDGFGATANDWASHINYARTIESAVLAANGNAVP